MLCKCKDSVNKQIQHQASPQNTASTFNNSNIKTTTMTALNIETLKQICDKLPGSYTVRVQTSNGDIINITDIIEVDLSSDTLILKE